MRRFAAFDIDGTLIRWQLFHTIVDTLASSGSISLHEHQIMKELHDKWKRRENLDAFQTYEAAMLKAWFALMRHTTVAEFNRAVDTAFETHKDYVYHYTRDLCKQLKAEDYTLIAISGSHQQIVDKIAEYYAFDYAIGSVYPLNENGTFTGEEITPVINKGKCLQEAVQSLKLSWDDSYAVGDSKSDAKMMELVHNPIAFNPDRNLLKIAKHNHWTIVIERKNVTYKLKARNGTYTLT